MDASYKATGLIADKGIELLSFRTPNGRPSLPIVLLDHQLTHNVGYKASIVLEELAAAYGINYTYQLINLPLGIQKQPWYLALNLNGKIPVIVDHDAGGFSLHEAHAIAQYLARKFDKDHLFTFSPFTEPQEVARMEQWLAWCTGELSPAFTTCMQFVRFHPDRDGVVDGFAQNKYLTVAEGALDVMNKHLEGRDYLVGTGRGKYSIADMLCFPFSSFTMACGLGRTMDRWPNVQRWSDEIAKRPAVMKGVTIPIPTPFANVSFRKSIEESEEAKTKEEAKEKQLREAREKYAKK
jgi:glutathione S-transferase